MSQPANPSLARLVLFIICIATAGSLIAFAWYFAVELPDQKQVPPAPLNTVSNSKCVGDCDGMCYVCTHRCKFCYIPGCSETCGYCFDDRAKCVDECYDEFERPCVTCRDQCTAAYESCGTRPGYTEGDCTGIRDSCLAACPCD
jgi:hypothetical protein